MDTAIYLSGSTNNLAIGVETCKCSESYNGTSCQDPADGYYRYKETTTFTETVEQSLEYFVGQSIACNCNGRSERCNKETGHCEVILNE